LHRIIGGFWAEYTKRGRGSLAKVRTVSSTDARTASRARGLRFYALSLSLNKERAKENQLGRSLQDLPATRRSDDERRGFLFWQNSSTLGAYIARPRWVCVGKGFCFPVFA